MRTSFAWLSLFALSALLAAHFMIINNALAPGLLLIFIGGGSIGIALERALNIYAQKVLNFTPQNRRQP